MIKIRYSHPVDLDLSGSWRDFRQLLNSICSLIKTDSRELIVSVETNFDPSPYNLVIPKLIVLVQTGPVKVFIQHQCLYIAGSPDNLEGFSSYLLFNENAKPGDHKHFEYYQDHFWIDPQSIPLVITIK